jgi:hypothetical protein
MPPCSPSEQNVPKRKRPGERIAKEIKQTVKRAKSTPKSLDELALANQMIKPKHRAMTASSQAPASTTHVSPSTGITKPKYNGISSKRDISPLQNTTQRLNTSKYNPQSGHISTSVSQPQQPAGTVSLIAPVTSMDLFHASQRQNHTFHSTSQPCYDPIQKPSPTTLWIPAPTRSRCAPSTGQALDPIQEEPLRILPKQSGAILAFQSPPMVDVVSKRSLMHSFQRTASRRKEYLPIEAPKKTLLLKKNVSTRSVEVARVVDEFDDFEPIDEDELFHLATTLASMHGANNDSCLKTDTGNVIQSKIGLLATQNSGDSLLDGFDDDDEWLRLSDVELESLDLIDSPANTTCNTEQMKHVALQAACPNFKASLQTQPSLTTNAPIPPVARPAFPSPILDRSPLSNITSSTVLRTCFRIGEALNVGAHYARQSSVFTSEGILIELYARVISSWRPSCHSGARQYFIFADLWSEKAPKLQAEWVSWKGSRLFEADAQNLLTDDDDDVDTKMCRVVGRLKREKKEWKFVILNAWECSWDDIEYVRGIVCQD